MGELRLGMFTPYNRKRLVKDSARIEGQSQQMKQYWMRASCDVSRREIYKG